MLEGLRTLFKSKAKKKNFVPEMQGVSTPSPMTIEVPSRVMNNNKYFANLLFSNVDFTLEARRNLLLGKSN